MPAVMCFTDRCTRILFLLLYIIFFIILWPWPSLAAGYECCPQRPVTNLHNRLPFKAFQSRLKLFKKSFSSNFINAYFTFSLDTEHVTNWKNWAVFHCCSFVIVSIFPNTSIVARLTSMLLEKADASIGSFSKPRRPGGWCWMLQSSRSPRFCRRPYRPWSLSVHVQSRPVCVVLFSPRIYRKLIDINNKLNSQYLQ